MAVFIKNGFEIGFAYYNGSTWSQGTVQGFVTGEQFEDPRVVSLMMMVGGLPTPVFVCAYKNQDSVFVRRFNEVSGAFGDSIFVFQGTGVGVDKPWLIAGALNPSGFQDAHAVWFNFGNRLWSSFSTDGGSIWTSQPVLELATGSPIITNFCAQPAIGDTTMPGPYYVAVTPSQNPPTWKILEAKDEAAPGNPPDWQFNFLTDGTTRGVLEMTGMGLVNGNQHVAGEFLVRTVPYLVADPTDPDRLYFVYHGLTDVNTKDVDVYCRTLTRTGSTGETGDWSAGPRVRVNDLLPVQPGGADFDQIFPVARVDQEGRLHIAFYDERDADNGPDTSTEADFSLYYAVSTDHGASFTNIRMTGIPHKPTLETTRTGPGVAPVAKWPPGEYAGIACDGDTVWIAFAGTSDLDINPDGSTPDQSVIFVVKIQY